MPLQLETMTDGAMTPIYIEEVEIQRQGLIDLRDQALKHSMMEWAVLLSHTIGTLSAVLEKMKG